MRYEDELDRFPPRLPSDYLIRECRRDDLPSVGEVEADAFANHDLYPPFFFVQALDIFAEGFLVAEHRDLVVGYIISVIGQGDDRSGWILSLGVLKKHRRRGIGTNLTARAEEFLARKGRSEPVLTVDPDNDVALSLFRRLGYREVTKFPGHFGQGEDRLLMGRCE